MKILLINGSPKCGQSDTLQITNAFIDGMNDVCDCEVRSIEAVKLNIGYCTGCLSCMNRGRCVLNDDMADVLSAFAGSDLILMSFPLYCYGVPAPMKVLLDRLLPLSCAEMIAHDGRYSHPVRTDLSSLHFAVISGCGFPNTEGNFEPLRLQMNLMFPYNLFMLTVAEAPLFNAPESAPVTVPYLDKVRRAGREYAESFSVSDNLMIELAMPMIPTQTYADICSMNAKQNSR